MIAIRDEDTMRDHDPCDYPTYAPVYDGSCADHIDAQALDEDEEEPNYAFTDPDAHTEEGEIPPWRR